MTQRTSVSTPPKTFEMDAGVTGLRNVSVK
jgi:hypothetical protein